MLGRSLMLYRAAIVLHTPAFVKCAAAFLSRCNVQARPAPNFRGSEHPRYVKHPSGKDQGSMVFGFAHIWAILLATFATIEGKQPCATQARSARSTRIPARHSP